MSMVCRRRPVEGSRPESQDRGGFGGERTFIGYECSGSLAAWSQDLDDV